MCIDPVFLLVAIALTFILTAWATHHILARALQRTLTEERAALARAARAVRLLPAERPAPTDQSTD